MTGDVVRCELKRGIADDSLRDVYVRGKYRDVILPSRIGSSESPPPTRGVSVSA